MKQLALIMFLVACGSKSGPPSTPSTPSNGDGSSTAPASGAPCVKGGCSGTLCSDKEDGMMTTCEFKAEYACYQSAACERQPDGACGWTQTDELTACLANPPPVQ